MDKLFFQIINMSITSSYVILFIMVVRLLLKKYPKSFSYALWSVVLFRLVCPFSFEGVFSLMPVNTQVVKEEMIYSKGPQINNGSRAIDSTVNQQIPARDNSQLAVKSRQVGVVISQFIWMAGMASLISYSLCRTVKLYKKLKFAKHVSENIYVMQGITTPFVLGSIKPKIYLPPRLSEKEKTYILLHEEKHIRRLDHMIKPFAFLVLCVHWFNPLVWAAFSLMSEDMELSCDESVIKQLGDGIKKEYSTSLLSLSSRKKIIRGYPLAFGEKSIKGRIKNILNYKKLAIWTTTLLVGIVILIGVGLIVDPVITMPLEEMNVDLSEEPLDKITVTPIGTFTLDLLNDGVIVKTLDRDTTGLQQLAQAIQMDALLKSTIFEGSDISILPVCYRMTWSVSEEEPTEYYAYVLPNDGRTVLQTGTQGFYAALDSKLFKQLQDLFYVPENIIDGLFEKLVGHPLTSSNPYDYIKANQAVFDEIVAYGDSALLYCYSRFEKGDQTDLKGQLMMKVCYALSDFPQKDMAYTNGQAWYKSFKEESEKLLNEKSLEYLEKYNHASYVLINYLKGNVGWER